MLINISPIPNIFALLYHHWTTVGIISLKLKQIGQLQALVEQVSALQAKQGFLSGASARKLDTFYKCFIQ